MARYFNRLGQSVPESEALINGMIRDGYSQLLEPGELLTFSPNLCDASPASRNAVFLKDAPAGSMDDAVKAEINAQAQFEGITAAEWLAKAEARTIERLVERAAKQYVSGLSGAGVASGLKLDTRAQRAVLDAMRQARYLPTPQKTAPASIAAPVRDASSAQDPASQRAMLDEMRHARYAR